MKRIQIWSMMMLVVMALPIMVACGDDDDNNGANYTEAEIVELLNGKWEVYGEAKYTDYERNETFTDNYKGKIEFKADKSVYFKVTDGKKVTYFDDAIDYYLEEIYINDYYKYTVLKKGGKNFISFGSSSKSYAFEIVSLKKNTFMLRLDKDLFDSDDNSKPFAHAYMTIVSN